MIATVIKLFTRYLLDLSMGIIIVAIPILTAVGIIRLFKYLVDATDTTTGEVMLFMLVSLTVVLMTFLGEMVIDSIKDKLNDR